MGLGPSLVVGTDTSCPGAREQWGRWQRRPQGQCGNQKGFISYMHPHVHVSLPVPNSSPSWFLPTSMPDPAMTEHPQTFEAL